MIRRPRAWRAIGFADWLVPVPPLRLNALQPIILSLLFQQLQALQITRHLSWVGLINNLLLGWRAGV